MNNGIMDRGDSGVAAWKPIISLFSRLGGTGVIIDPFAAGTFWQDTAGTVAPVAGGTIARIDSPAGSPIIASFTQALASKHPTLQADGLAFDGVDDELSFPDNANLRFGTTDFTIAIAFKTPGNATQTLISKRGSGGTPGVKPGWGMRVSATNAIAFEYDYNGNIQTVTQNVSPVNSVSLNTWTNGLLQFEYSSGLAKSFINNVEQAASKTYTVGDLGAGTTFQPLMIGAIQGGNPFNGTKARGIVINKILSSADKLIVNDWLKGGRP